MCSKGYFYFRYVDDIKVVCADEFQARKALKDLVLSLRGVGLSVNSKKTTLCAGSNQAAIKGCFEEGSPDVELIAQLWKTKARGPILRSIPILKSLTLKCINDGEVDSRSFRYCINRLIDLTRCEDFEVPTGFFQQITPAVLEAIPKFPASTDQYVRYLGAAPITEKDLSSIGAIISDTSKSFYHWQNYRLWSLLAEKQHRDPALISKAIDLISSGRDDATRAGATLYCGVLGDREDRITITKQFRNLTSFLGQRSALIAVHDLPFRPYIEDEVARYVRTDLIGVYKQLQKQPGRYYVPPEQMPITKLIGQESQYD